MKQTIKVADKPTADEIKSTVESNAEKLDGIAQSLESGGMLSDPSLGLAALKQSLDELKNYVGNGKRDVASAITAKGIPTATDANFTKIVENIESIVTLMQGTQDANATASQILKGYSAYVKGVKVNGGINSLGAQIITPGIADKTIAANQYLSGVQTIAGDSNLVAANIAKGKSIFGIAGNYEGGAKLLEGTVSGNALTGNGTIATIPNVPFTPKYVMLYLAKAPNYDSSNGILFKGASSHVFTHLIIPYGKKIGFNGYSSSMFVANSVVSAFYYYLTASYSNNTVTITITKNGTASVNIQVYAETWSYIIIG